MHTLRPLAVEEVAALKHKRFFQENKIISKRMQAIYQLIENRFTRQEIGKFLDLHPDTIKEYILLFNMLSLCDK